MIITDKQYHTILNNQIGLTLEEIEGLTKDEATSIISDMYSGGFERYTLAPGVAEFWKKVKNYIREVRVAGE